MPKDYQLQASGRYRASMQTLQGSMRNNYTIDLVLKKNILKNKGSLSLQVRDVLNSRGNWRFTTETDVFYLSSNRQRETRNFFINFSYNFGKLQDRQSRRRGSGDDDGGFDDDMMDMN